MSRNPCYPGLLLLNLCHFPESLLLYKKKCNKWSSRALYPVSKSGRERQAQHDLTFPWTLKTSNRENGQRLLGAGLGDGEIVVTGTDLQL